MNAGRETQFVCPGCSKPFSTQPALTTHKNGCGDSKKRFSSAISGAKANLLARKKRRVDAVLNATSREISANSEVS